MAEREAMLLQPLTKVSHNHYTTTRYYAATLGMLLGGSALFDTRGSHRDFLVRCVVVCSCVVVGVAGAPKTRVPQVSV